MLNVGDKAPDFTAKDENAKKIKLSDFAGKKVALYFYPKDDTPGCTKQACSFRDNFDEVKKKGIHVIGVSMDDENSHQKFIEKYNLPFTLITDPDKDVIEKYGVWKEKKYVWQKKWGIARTTFLINEEGNIVHIFKKPKTDIHAEEVMEKFK